MIQKFYCSFKDHTTFMIRDAHTYIQLPMSMLTMDDDSKDRQAYGHSESYKCARHGADERQVYVSQTNEQADSEDACEKPHVPSSPELEQVVRGE